MKVLICSDIHGNVRALRAVLQVYRDEHVRELLFLGDSVGYGAHPDACLDTLFNMPRAHLIIGNHEAALLDERERNEMNGLAAGAIDWSGRMLDRKYVDAIRRKFTMRYERGEYDAVHASPYHPEEWIYIFGPLEAEQAFFAGAFAVCFFGHTHVPALYVFGGGELRIDENVPFHFEPGARYLVNPGSVGQPRDGDPRAACCIFDTDSGTITLRRCPYDVAAEAQDILDAGLPRYLGERLFRGV